jgi:hypothetical protein
MLPVKALEPYCFRVFQPTAVVNKPIRPACEMVELWGQRNKPVGRRGELGGGAAADGEFEMLVSDAFKSRVVFSCNKSARVVLLATKGRG